MPQIQCKRRGRLFAGICSAGILAAAVQPAGAKLDIVNDSDSAMLATIKTFGVEILDDVKDGCFTNKDAVKVAAELSLRKSGINVVEKDGDGTVFIYALGYRTRSRGGDELGCTVHVFTELQALRPMMVPYANGAFSFEFYKFRAGGVLLTGPEALNAQIKNAVAEDMERLANEILKARSIFDQANPEIAKRRDAAD